MKPCLAVSIALLGLVIPGAAAFAQLPPPPPPESAPLPPTPPPVKEAPPSDPTRPPNDAPPPWGAPILGGVAPATKRHSKGMMIAGIVMAGAGGLAIVAGSVEVGAANGICNLASSQALKYDSCVSLYRGVGIGELIFGGVLLAIGVPLALVGSAKEPVNAAQITPALSIHVAPQDTGLRWTF